MIIYSDKGVGETKVVMSGEEFRILRSMVRRVQPLTAQERDMLVDLGNDEEEE